MGRGGRISTWSGIGPRVSDGGSLVSSSWKERPLHDDVIKWQHLPHYWAICAGNSPVPGEFPTQRPVMRSFDAYFDLRPNKRLSKQSSGWWFKTPSCQFWRHRSGPEAPRTSYCYHLEILEFLLKMISFSSHMHLFHGNPMRWPISGQLEGHSTSLLKYLLFIDIIENPNVLIYEHCVILMINQ